MVDNDLATLALEDLPASQREMAEIIGMDAFMALCAVYGGDTVYIMKYEELQKPGRNKEIIEKFDGYNMRELAKEYSLAVRTIYNIVTPVLKSKRNDPGPDQMGFEEYLGNSSPNIPRTE